MSNKSFPLQSNDGQIHNITKEAAQLSSFLSDLIELNEDAGRENEPIELDIPGDILALIISFCDHYLLEPMEEIEKVRNTLFSSSIFR